MNAMADETRCIGVAVFAVRRLEGPVPASEVLLLLRAGGGFEDEWCPIAGSLEPGERAADAALREAREETGLRLSDLRELPIRVLHAGRGAPPGGHIQLFVARAGAAERVVLNREHSDHCWVDFDEAVRRVSLDGQRRAIREVERLVVRGEEPRPMWIEPPY